MSDLEYFNNIFENFHTEWPFSFSRKEMKIFGKLSGDFNPIHSDEEYAKSNGFKAPIVYGLLLASQLSRLVGQELPDKKSILTGIKIDFLLPCYTNDKLIFKANVVNTSSSTFSVDLKCLIQRDEVKICRGLVNAIWRP